MALNPVERLRQLKDIKRALTGLRAQTANAGIQLSAAYPDLAAQISTFFGSLDAQYGQALTAVHNALAAVSPTNVEKLAYADAAVADAQNLEAA